MKKAIVLGASRGIGKSISDSLKKLDLDVVSLSSNDIDTSNLHSVNRFADENNSTDILVLNTGGPPIIEFERSHCILRATKHPHRKHKTRKMIS